MVRKKIYMLRVFNEGSGIFQAVLKNVLCQNKTETVIDETFYLVKKTKLISECRLLKCTN